MRLAGIVALLSVYVLSLTMTVRANSNALLIELPNGVLPTAVSANGTIVGALETGGGFYWMPTTGDIFVGGKAAVALSRDGRTIVGTGLDPRSIEQAGIWQRAAEWRLLGSIASNAAPCDTLLSSSYGTSATGNVIVGLAWNGCTVARAFRWEASTGMVDLGSTVAGRSSRANGVSGDGKVVVGFQDHATGFRQGARWTDGRQELFTGPSGLVGQANEANMDGSIVVGQVCRPISQENPFDQSAWIWTARDGLQCLPIPQTRPNYIGIAFATSDDGHVIGGAHSFGLDSDAVLWIDRVPSYVKDYLRSHGVPAAFDGWINTGYLTAVSPDGRLLVGYGAGPRDFKGYLIILGDTP
ncbi:MAG TPA: hypothetical protein VKE96_00425 [Vicinamibacterales bacterium]|nr:hypothetical protein [Vicinamibacterales bacterium]